MNRKRGKVIAIIVCLAMVSAVFLSTPVGAISGQKVNLNKWTTENYYYTGNWSVSNKDNSVTQLETNPNVITVFYSDFPAYNTRIEGTVAVKTSSDDDYFGFAIGFNPGDSSNPSADYLLIDWKQNTQYANDGYAYRGLAVSHVTGVPTTTLADFWRHIGTVTELARGITLGGTGWADYNEYVFTIEFTPTSLKVYVDDVLQFDIAGSFSDGRFAFYDFSQRDVKYSNFTVQTITEAIPPGWDEGDKTGWDDSIPPGLDNNDKTPPGFDDGNKTGWD